MNPVTLTLTPDDGELVRLALSMHVAAQGYLADEGELAPEALDELARLRAVRDDLDAQLAERR